MTFAMLRYRILSVALASAVAAGCVAAAAGAAGGVAAQMAYNDRGAETHVSAGVTAAATAAEAALHDLGITITKRESEADKVEIKGTDGDREISVNIQGNTDAGQTHILVTAKKHEIDYDRSRASEILTAIVNRLT